MRLFFEKKNFPKGPPFNFFGVFRQNGCWKIPFSFFGIVRLLKKIFLFHQKCPSFNFFWWFETEWMKNFEVSPLVCQFGSTFGFFRYRRREYLEVLLLFLSLRYGADLGRSRLVFFRLQSSHWSVHFSYNSYNLKILQFLLSKFKILAQKLAK